ncbi:YjbQ family protein [Brumimicrobium glaciale]|nr:YjbQ family protein [Brumimicrobium glaciale]
MFIKHTSAGLAINENADPTVRVDFVRHFNKFVP